MTALITAVDFIKKWEGFKPKAYLCPSNVWTIGFGRTYGVQIDETTTVEEETAWLTNHVEELLNSVTSHYPDLNSNQHASLTSFAYNCGLSALLNSTLNKRIKTNSKDLLGITDAFTMWNKGNNSKVLLGLTNRRKEEAALFFKTITTKTTMETNTMRDLFRAATYTKAGEEHQQKAWDWLQDQFPDTVCEEFMTRFRDTLKFNVVAKPPGRSVTYLSQRDNQGDWNGDGRQDSVQTCQVTSVAMVLNSFSTKTNITPKQVDSAVRRLGDRYTHSVLARYMTSQGLKVEFDTQQTVPEIKACLDANGLVIWSNRLTLSGHVVVVSSYNEKGFVLFDPYGEVIINGSAKPTYVRNDHPYTLSYASFDRFSANGNSSKHWAHLITK